MEWEVCLMLIGLTFVSAQVYEYCPAPWKEFESNCYKFVNKPVNLQTAYQNCQRDGASLVSINSHAEHDFIVQYLTDNDPFKQTWYTSGKRRGSGGTEFYWEGDGSKVSSYQFWVDENAQRGDGDYIVYSHPLGVHWGWLLRSPTQDFSYICEIAKTETYKIYEVNRGFGYGIMETDPQKFKRGPQMTLQPKDVIYDTDTTKKTTSNTGEEEETKLPVSMECVAVSNPAPSYKWYKRGRSQNAPIIYIDTLTETRYTMTNGRLTINNPEERVDYGNYYCTAENSFGSILSDSALLSFGYLRDFPKTTREPVRVDEYYGTAIDCKPPAHYPEVFYSWYKDDVFNFIRPELKPYIFISKKGKLMFSKVTDDDAGKYYCMVFSPKQSITVSEGKVSTGIQLIVTESAASVQEPEIASGFPSINPNNPKMGDTVTIECFAWGTGDLRYSWYKVASQTDSTAVKMPSKVFYTDRNRVLHMPNLELKDGGFYRCVAKRLNGLEAHDTAELIVEALPFFRIPLEHQHLDVGQDLTWRCQADGVPSITYSWYKDTKQLTQDTLLEADKDRISVQTNVLTIKNVDPVKDSGMYQCGATNIHGQRFSSAQLRVMAFKPTFAKFPLQPNQYATISGNVTIRCMPESAPRATTEWKKNGAKLNPGTDDNLRVRLLPNGNLFIGPVQQSDAGDYTCVAKNSLGTAESSGKLTVLSSTTITNMPRNTVVEVNKTAYMECEASYNPLLDVTYIWYHNKHKIDFSFRPDPHFEMGSGVNRGGLYIKNAQAEHGGVYTCVAQTTSDIISAFADLKVIGPPGEPSGVVGSEVTQNSIVIRWLDGLANGRAIISYVIEGYTDTWRIVKAKVIGDEALAKKAQVTGLSPNVTYQFRVRAENVLGTGAPSAPSTRYTTRPDRPYTYPKELGGGGGKVGDLTITWKPMPEVEWNGNKFFYLVQWRKTGSDSDTDWEEMAIKNPYVSRFVNTVGKVNSYTQYDVRIRAENIEGQGDWSPVVRIRSAMDLPVAVPTNVRADTLNSTALLVSWDPVRDTIKDMNGVLGGYRINYWKEEGEFEAMAMKKTINGQADEGIIIGLDVKTYYVVNVNVWNLAGNGPKSQDFEEETLRAAPLDYPTEVEVIPNGANSVEVRWRGVSTSIEEEPLQGYKVRYWRRGETIYAAQDVDAEKETRTLIEDLEDDTVYNVRVLGYSLGGDGAMSRTLQFTIGQNCRTFDVVLDKAVDKDYVYKCAGCHVLPPTGFLVALLICQILKHLW